MKASLNIVLPIVAAIALSATIGALFLWQIQTSVATIEKGFQGKSIRAKAQSDFNDNQFAKEQKQDPQALELLRIGEMHMLQGQWNEAEKSFQESVAAGGGMNALRNLARLQMQRRKYEDAKTTIEKMRQQEPSNNDIQLLAGILELRRGKIEEARKTFSLLADTEQGKYGLALIAIVQNQHDQAKKLLTEVMQTSNTLLKTYASTLLSAYNEYNLFAEKQDIHLKTLLARALAQTNECETALPMLADVINARENYRDAWIVKGYCEYTTERLQEAQTSLERAYALDPEKPEIQYFLARTYDAQGDTGNAITFLQYAIINGFSPQKDAQKLLANYALKINHPELALEQYRAIFTQQPNDFSTIEQYVQLALTLSPTHAADAYSTAEEAKKRWPDEPAVLTLAAQTAIANGKMDEAKQDLQRALKVNPKYEQAKALLKTLPNVAL